MTELNCPKTIVLPVDLSAASTAAARCAELVASRFGAKIILLHVVEPVANPYELLGTALDPRSLREAARDEVAKLAGPSFSSVKPEIHTVAGDPAGEIVSAAKELGADLLVMSTRGKGAFRRFVLGSVTAKILNDIPVPVLTTAHTEQTAQSCRSEVKKVLCAVALDDRCHSVCRAAVMVAAEYKANLTLVHVPESGSDDSVRERLRDVAAACGAASADLRLEKGSPHKAVPEAARSTAADIVVIGRSSPGPLGRLRAQSYGIIRESPVPVLSV